MGDFLIDLPPGGKTGLCTTDDDYADAWLEVESRQAMYGALAGIPDAEIAAAALAQQRIAAIDAVLPAAEKLVEVLTETRASLVDECHRRVLDVATMVDRRSRRHPELLAQYEKARAYRSARANKAAATRRRNEANAVEAGADETTLA